MACCLERDGSSADAGNHLRLELFPEAPDGLGGLEQPAGRVGAVAVDLRSGPGRGGGRLPAAAAGSAQTRGDRRTSVCRGLGGWRPRAGESQSSPALSGAGCHRRYRAGVGLCDPGGYRRPMVPAQQGPGDRDGRDGFRLWRHADEQVDRPAAHGGTHSPAGWHGGLACRIPQHCPAGGAARCRCSPDAEKSAGGSGPGVRSRVRHRHVVTTGLAAVRPLLAPS